MLRRGNLWIASLTLAMTVCFSAQDSYADEKEKAEAAPFQIEGCDFAITLPEAPRKTTRCKNPKTPGLQRQSRNECYDAYVFTQTFTNEKNGKETLLEVETFCRPSTDILYSYYDEKSLESAVRALVSDRSVVSPTIGYNQENPAVKISSLTNGNSQYSKNNLITAQIHVSKNSLFGAKIILTGAESQEADIAFNTVLESVAFEPAFVEKAEKN